MSYRLILGLMKVFLAFIDQCWISAVQVKVNQLHNWRRLFLTMSNIFKRLIFLWYFCCVCLAVFLQWFGNIVTMDWWDDLWLNEGFASFFEYVGVEQAEKDWGMVRTQSIKVVHGTLYCRPRVTWNVFGLHSETSWSSVTCFLSWWMTPWSLLTPSSSTCRLQHRSHQCSTPSPTARYQRWVTVHTLVDTLVHILVHIPGKWTDGPPWVPQILWLLEPLRTTRTSRVFAF